ncbi:unnamed protein product [Lupinus luteus]|uniref:Uncharacterized protein n=1 Tax=Lupinus luteus TaxID=3873 RepID=A0AAV1XVQ4_LUPLU
MHYTTMNDSEKLLALKKVYADIILNTAKEAAARVMASERKAMCFKQELASTRDEALPMLLRLKQMFDSKVTEAELTSLSQRNKIDELEAQLQEAEEIVSNLRAELREAETNLESVANYQMYPPVEQNVQGEIPTQESCLQDNIFDPYEGSVNPLSDSLLDSVSISYTKNPTVSGINDSSKFCVSHDHTDKCHILNPDFASIVIRRKESELYRNGCTQRIRAFERSHFDANMGVSGNSDNVHDETSVRVQEEGKEMPVTTITKTDTIYEREKPDELIMVKADTGGVSVPACKRRRKYIKALRSMSCSIRVRKRRKTLYLAVKVPVQKRRRLTMRLHSYQVKKTNKAWYLSDAKGSPCVLDNSDPPSVDSSMVCEKEAEKYPMSLSSAKLPTDEAATTRQSESHDDIEKVGVFLNACSVQNKNKDDKDLLAKSYLTRQESLSAESLEVPCCRTDVEQANGSRGKPDSKASHLDEKVSCQPANDKFLKYTFQRKRKKEPVSSANADCSLENDNWKKYEL